MKAPEAIGRGAWVAVALAIISCSWSCRSGKSSLQPTANPANQAAVGSGSGKSNSLPMEKVYVPEPDAANDERHAYSDALLQAALDKTSATYGPAKVAFLREVVNEKRRVNLLVHGSPLLDVITRPTARDFERQLVPIRIPTEKGLLGYRIFLIRAADQPIYSKIRTLDALKRLRAGQEKDWLDVSVYRSNGFDLVTGSNYESLFEMLANDRFDYFPRGVTEVFPEFNSHQRLLPNLAVEHDLMIHYPFASYFWVANNKKGTVLRGRITQGLESMIRDGSFDALFWKFYGEAIERAGLSHRRVFEIKNTTLPDTMPVDRPELWFDPAKSRPHQSPDAPPKL